MADFFFFFFFSMLLSVKVFAVTSAVNVTRFSELKKENSNFNFNWSNSQKCRVVAVLPFFVFPSPKLLN